MAMLVEMWAIDRPKPYEKNPRKIPQKAIDKVADAIKAFGFRQPVVVDRAGVIIVGHTRLLAAKKLGLKEVPVHVADLDEVQARAYRLADNRVAQETDWLDDVLGDELAALKDLGFDLDLTGFDERELLSLLDNSADIAKAEEIPETPENPISRPGDVWLLGRHRIICGDSTSATDVGKVLGPVKPHLMVTDPPYGVEYDPKWRLETGINKAHQKRAEGVVENDDRADWREAWALFPGDVAYIWHGGLQTGPVFASLTAAGFPIRSHIIWAKPSLVIGRGHYHWQHEACFYAVRNGATGHWGGDSKQSTVWHIENMHATQGNTDDGKTMHSTQKPVECMRRPILNNSSEGQAVYEPFSGSGTTIIACEMTGRICYAVELNPAYVDVAILRWQKFANLTAVLDETGQTFVEVMAERDVSKVITAADPKSKKGKKAA